MLSELFEKIVEERNKELSRDLGPFPKNNPTASDLSPCARETTIAILHWQERPPFTPETMARLQVGKEAEPIILSKLARYGIQVVEQQQVFELKNKAGRVILRGKIDGKVELPDRRRIPFDVKTVNPNAFARMNSVQDLLNHSFFQKWPKQIWAYEYMNNIDLGFLLLDNLLGDWRFIEVPMDWQRMEEIIQQCEHAVAAVEAVRAGAKEDDVLPEYHKDPAVCRRCWAFGKLCTPPMEFHGLALMEDPDFEEMLNRRGELEVSHKEYEALDKTVKQKIKGKDGLVVGQWLIQGKEVSRKGYTVGDSVYWLPKITKTGE